METVTKKKIAPMWALIAVIIIAGILFLAFRPTNQVDAPTIDGADDTTATSTVATSTAVTPTTVAPATSGSAAVAPATTPGVQVIQGDGFTATIRPVEGVAPTIKSFTVRQSTAGASCIFTWDTKDATSCEVINTTAKTSVRGVPEEGTLQTSDAGAYQLSCKGTGGKTAVSALVSCN
jgi:hypothetical protein